MEIELLMTGIGGQGIQLAAQVMARAALAEGRYAQLFGSYAGMMRGGSTEATLVLADTAVEAPPTVHAAWAAILMHHEYAEHVLSKLRPRALALRNTTVFEGDIDGAASVVVDVPATDIAVETGHIMTATMVMAGAFAKLTGLVGLDALSEAVADALPAYRSQHVALNRAALDAGYAAVEQSTELDWMVRQ